MVQRVNAFLAKTVACLQQLENRSFQRKSFCDHEDLHPDIVWKRYIVNPRPHRKSINRGILILFALNNI